MNNSDTRTFALGDRVVCIIDEPFNAAGRHLAGVVLCIFRNGRVLVEVGKPGSKRFDHDARMFDADKVKRA